MMNQRHLADSRARVDAGSADPASTDPASLGLDPACADFTSSISRRTAIRSAIGVAAGLAVASSFGDAFVETAYAAGGGKAERMLVVLSLRGGADGLSLVVPHGDRVYYEARPDIAIEKSKLLAADSFFGLHPAFKPLLPLWKEGRIAAIHAAGQQITTRSHFSAMEEVEDADPGSPQRVGWLNRMISLRGGVSDTTALQLGDPSLATQLTGPAPAVAAPDLRGLALAGPEGEDAAGWEAGLAKLWQGAPKAVASGGGRAIAVSKAYAPARDRVASAVTYPDGDLGAALRATASVLKSNVGAEVVTIDQGSWDHHEWVGNIDAGNLKRVAEPLAAGLAAFFDDLGSLSKKVTVVTISEFGRRIKQNDARGLDHGHGNVMFVLGAGVKGGYYGRWPKLENTLDADLAVTTDYRDVLSEVVASLYPERSLAAIFPSFRHKALGFMAGNSGHVDEGKETVGPTKPVPKSYFKSYGTRTGTARVGAKMKAPKPKLTTAGKKARVKTTYRWETVSKTGKVKKRKKTRTLTVPASYQGKRLRVRVTYKAKGFKPRVKVFSWGKVKKRKKK